MATNKKQDCKFSVPRNQFGIVAMHCFDNQKFSDADTQKILAGPIAAIEAAYQAELAKVAVVSADEFPTEAAERRRFRAIVFKEV